SESSPEFTNTKGTKVAQISSLFVRDANFVPNMSIDEIRIDTTWENVVNVPLATNETTGTKKAIISNTFVTDSFKLLTENKAKVEIYSATGTLVKQGEFASEAEINVAHLSSGLYIVKINEGGNTYTTKIIKK
ncbi:MAG: T9SS type A sorting domain-containing protein, partial [Bergeyella zoohelcum]|nr:T9SS type A sorting domain-containing protein [Bergeyella zoohelcum]